MATATQTPVQIQSIGKAQNGKPYLEVAPKSALAQSLPDGAICQLGTQLYRATGRGKEYDTHAGRRCRIYLEPCGTAQAPLYNSPPPAELGTSSADPAQLAAKFGRKAVEGAKVEHRAVYGLSKGDDGDKNGTIHLVRRKKGAPLVRVLQVARSKRVYLSPDWIDDMDMHGTEPGGSYDWDGVEVEPTPEELAKDAEAQARRDAEAAKLKAAQEEVARKEAAAQAAVESLKTGLAESTVGPPDRAELLPVAGASAIQIGNSSYLECALADGRRIVKQEFSTSDDWRTYYYAPADVCRRWALAYAAQVGITCEKAVDWLSKYSGCHGSDIYRAVAEATEQEKTTLQAAAVELAARKAREDAERKATFAARNAAGEALKAVGLSLGYYGLQVDWAANTVTVLREADKRINRSALPATVQVSGEGFAPYTLTITIQ